jgi:hypothetical protein
MVTFNPSHISSSPARMTSGSLLIKSQPPTRKTSAPKIRNQKDKFEVCFSALLQMNQAITNNTTPELMVII